MTSRDFIYWLQGYFEVSGTDEITPAQVRIIRNHLNLVFKHEIDPSIHGSNTVLAQSLQNIHDGLPAGDELVRC